MEEHKTIWATLATTLCGGGLAVMLVLVGAVRGDSSLWCDPWFLTAFVLAVVLMVVGAATFVGLLLVAPRRVKKRLKRQALDEQRRRDVEALQGLGPPPKLSLGVVYGQSIRTLVLDSDKPDEGWFFWLPNVVVTNRGSEPVSLMPDLAMELEHANPGSVYLLDQVVEAAVPKGFTRTDRLIEGPIDIDPGKSSRRVDLGFSVSGAEEKQWFGADGLAQGVKRIGDRTVFYVVWRDRVSGAEVAHEVTYRPSSLTTGTLTLDALLKQKQAARDLHLRNSLGSRPSELARALVDSSHDNTLRAHYLSGKRYQRLWDVAEGLESPAAMNNGSAIRALEAVARWVRELQNYVETNLPLYLPRFDVSRDRKTVERASSEDVIPFRRKVLPMLDRNMSVLHKILTERKAL